MPLKGLLNRPSTSASSKRFSAIEPGQSPSKSSKSPERGHRKIGSLQRLSLSFAPSKDGGIFQNFLTDEPDELQSRKNSLADRPSDSTPSANAVQNIEHSADTSDRPLLPPIEQDEPNVQVTSNGKRGSKERETVPKSQRFSLLRFRNASEPQLSTRFKEKQQLSEEPVPKIITTAPTQPLDSDTRRKSREGLLPRTFSSFRKSQVIREEIPYKPSTLDASENSDAIGSSLPKLTRTLSDSTHWVNRQERDILNSPPAYGDESNSALALPLTRLSESSRSEGSSGSHKLYAQTTTTHFIETTTTIFKLKRNKQKKTKDKGPLFPLPERLPQPSSRRTSVSQHDNASTGRKSMSPTRSNTHGVRWKSNLIHPGSENPSPSSSATGLTNFSSVSPGPAVARKQSSLSVHSGTSTPTATLIPPRIGPRSRSSTLGSIGRSAERLVDPHVPTPSGRTSTSTGGRRSFGDILTSRLRQNSGPPRHGSNNSGSTPGSKANSFQIARESEPELVYPPREDTDTPASYLEKLEAAVPKGAMATALCKGSDEFSKTCLRKYMRGFSYFGESIDMSIRKMLMEVILPKETQQIDRLLSGFADRYHECNPGIFMNADEANFVAFSILLLHSDNHNKSNKRKMTKQDYVKNTLNGRISVCEDVLECFYDNICYTPFIHFEDEIAVNSHRLAAPKRKGGLIKSKSIESLRGPVDPYTLILDNKLDSLKPSLKDVIDTDDTYGASASATSTSSTDNHKAFVHAAVLQIVSARSRPDAFTNQATITNPAEAQAGLVSIKVAKVGLLWRKSVKKKKAKSPWQEWGVILTDSKLYFFKDVGWVKKLISQYEGHAKTSTRNTPLVFKPPLTSFDPDAWMSMDDAVALTDSSYKRHKNAFTFIKHGGLEEVFLANTDVDVTEWIVKLNYAATFLTAGIRMRGLLGVNYEGRTLYQKDSEVPAKTGENLSNDTTASTTGKTNPQLAWEIMFYRRQLVSEKISSFDDHVAAAQKELEYLLRNARHLLILLPVQQKTREAVILAAGRMSAKLKWTRKEIWRAKTHRDILVKDLEAEATSAFPVPPTAPRSPASASTPQKATPTRSTQGGMIRSDTDQTITSTLTKSTLAVSPMSTSRRPSQSILEQIQTESSEGPELSTRRASATSHATVSALRPTEDGNSETVIASPSLHSRPSQHMSVAESQQKSEGEVESEVLTAVSPSQAETTPHKDLRRGSESEKDRRHHLPQAHDSLKDRTGSVRRSLQRTLRESSHHVHIPAHSRGKKGKESGSSVAATDDGARSTMSHESEELKRDPTGKFVLHGKKASVITMNPDWQLGTEDRIRFREQMSQEEATAETSEQEHSPLRIDTGTSQTEHRDIGEAALVSTQDEHSESRSLDPRSESDKQDIVEPVKRHSTRDSNTFTVYSAVTTPVFGDTFHSAESSPRASSDDEEQNDDEPEMGPNFEDESTFVKDEVTGLNIKNINQAHELANDRSATGSPMEDNPISTGVK